jgi:NADPH-dependent curcumin reductase CurA
LGSLKTIISTQHKTANKPVEYVDEQLQLLPSYPLWLWLLALELPVLGAVVVVVAAAAAVVVATVYVWLSKQSGKKSIGSSTSIDTIDKRSPPHTQNR